MNSVISSEFLGFNSYTPVVPSGPAAPYSAAGAADYSEDKTSSKKSGGSSKLLIGGLDESMIKLLTEHGLESDVYSFLNDMEAVITNAYDPITGKVNYAAYKLMLPKLARIREEGKSFEEARKKMEANNTLGEIAVSDRGLVYIVDPDQGIIKKYVLELTGDEYILTNGELAKARATNPSAAWDTDFTVSISNGVSTLQITKYLLDNINKLGKDETARELFLDADGDVISGAQALKEMISGHKGYSKTTINEDSQKLQALYALNYIAGTLPLNMLTVLQVKAQQHGTDVVSLMDSLIQSTVDSKKTVKTEFKGAGSGDGSGSDELSKTKLTPSSALYLGRTPVIPDYLLSYGSSNTFVGDAQVSNLIDSGGNNLAAGSVISDFFQGEMKNLFDTNNMVMGNQKIENPNTVRIKDSSLLVMELPIDLDALEKGVIRPDLALLAKKDKADQMVRTRHATTPEEINKIYAECNMHPLYNSDGSKNELYYIRFGIVKGYTDEQTLENLLLIDEDPWTNYLYKVKNESVDTWIRSLYKSSKTDVGGDLYEGNIYMPMISNNGMYLNAAAGVFNNVSIGQFDKIILRDNTKSAALSNQFKPAGGISQLK